MRAARNQSHHFFLPYLNSPHFFASQRTMGANEEQDEDQGEQIRICLRLAPGVNDPSLEVPLDPIAVPSNLRRKGLSALVNHLLGRKVPSEGNGESGEELKGSDDEMKDDEGMLPALPFDFILNGKLLRMGVEAAVRRDGLSLEEAVEIRYFVAQTAPTTSGTSETLPDWVSALSFTPIMKQQLPYDGFVFSGCYDGSIRTLLSETCAVLTSVKAHSGAIKCLDSTVWNDNDGEAAMVVTGSMDQTLLTHILTVLSSEGRGDVQKCSMKLHGVYTGGHFNSIESVAITQSSSNQRFLASGDWDGKMCLWKVPASASGAEQVKGGTSKKRQKVDSSSSSKGSKLDVAEVSSVATWKSHASNISGIVWGVKGGNDQQHLITSSWDHSCKVWDVERQDCILSLNGSRVVSALGRCINSDIIATGHVSLTAEKLCVDVNLSRDE